MQVTHDKKLECIPALITCLSNVPKIAIKHQATVNILIYKHYNLITTLLVRQQLHLYFYIVMCTMYKNAHTTAILVSKSLSMQSND